MAGDVVAIFYIDTPAWLTNFVNFEAHYILQKFADFCRSGTAITNIESLIITWSFYSVDANRVV
jgi:hypothetical protein